MRILQINDDTLVDIKKVKEYAERNIVSIDTIKAAVECPMESIPVGDNPEHVVHIHDGFRVVYSIEEQPIGLIAHLSISVEALGKYPNEVAVNMILKEFGMDEVTSDSKNAACAVWIEEKNESVNIVQKFKQVKL
jgi:hypothetical protein